MKNIKSKKEYQELKEPCRTAIQTGKCLGCNQLENEYFSGDKNCKILKK